MGPVHKKKCSNPDPDPEKNKTFNQPITERVGDMEVP
jgi:hypothetical protein